MVHKPGSLWLLYLLILAFVAIVALEVGTRILGLAPGLPSGRGCWMADVQLRYRLRPLCTISGRAPSGEFEYEYRHNEHGFRDHQHTLVKPKGVFRILGVGDSFTYGVGASFEETYLRQLEKLFNARPGDHPPVEIIKAGIPRYYPEPQRLLIQRQGMQFHPDVVMVSFVPNDVLDTSQGLEVIEVSEDGHLLTREGEGLGSAGMWLFRNSHFMRVLLSRYSSRLSRRQHPLRPDDVYRPNGYHETDWRQVEKEYERILDITRDAGAELVLVYIPGEPPWGNAADYPARRLEEWARRNGVELVDTLPALKRTSENQTLYWEKDGHCTPKGYFTIAEELFAELEGRGIVP